MNPVDVTPKLMGSAPRADAHNRASILEGSMDLIWNLIGLLGLFGIFGLWRNTDNDGYTDDPI